jgi:hypothetical protein
MKTKIAVALMLAFGGVAVAQPAKTPDPKAGSAAKAPDPKAPAAADKARRPRLRRWR